VLPVQIRSGMSDQSANDEPAHGNPRAPATAAPSYVQTAGRLHAGRAQIWQTFSKVQEPDRLNAPRRSRRPLLSRRWKLDPVSGKPVCAWQVAPTCHVIWASTRSGRSRSRMERSPVNI
jgi:hypothetical protein